MITTIVRCFGFIGVFFSCLLNAAQAQRTSYHFTRWGNSTCPSGSSLVYEGFASASDIDHTGGGYNTLCLNVNPSFPTTSQTLPSLYGAVIYGLEYQQPTTLSNQEAPCAVCAAVGPTFVLYGSNECPTGYSVEYFGVVSTSKFDSNSQDFVCVDENPVAIDQSVPQRTNGGQWYFAEVDCAGSLPCPPYNDNGNPEVTCAQCTADPNVVNKTGDVFTYWGKSNSCPSGSDVVYKGYAAGSSTQQSGSGGNIMCLSDDPKLPKFPTLAFTQVAPLFGVKYQTAESWVPVGLQDVDGQDAVCTVCQSAGVVLMQPGSTVCPTGFNTEFTGYLVSSDFRDHDQTTVCLSSNPDLNPITSDPSETAAQWHFSEIRCGALQCSSNSYVAAKEVGCAVCSTTTGGEVFNRWGTTDCNALSSTLVYSGLAVSGSRVHQGSSTENLCMPLTPTYPTETDPDDNAGLGRNLLYGTVYKTGVGPYFQALNGLAAPCAVCQAFSDTGRDTLCTSCIL